MAKREKKTVEAPEVTDAAAPKKQAADVAKPKPKPVLKKLLKFQGVK